MSDLQDVHDRGWAATLDLAYARSGARTVPTRREHTGPLCVQKHFEPEPTLCEHILVHPPGGIAAGDRLRIDVVVGPEARVRLTTPGATRWYRGEHGASQHLAATVADGACLELLPHPHLVFDGALATSHLTVALAADATFIGWDVVGLGRPAGDHPFASGRWSSRLELTRAGRLAYHDALDLPADSPARNSALGLAGHVAWGTALFVARAAGAPLVDALRGVAANLSTGVSLVGESLVAARALGPAEAIHQWFIALWEVALPALTGRVARAPRIWRT